MLEKFQKHTWRNPKRNCLKKVKSSFEGIPRDFIEKNLQAFLNVETSDGITGGKRREVKHIFKNSGFCYNKFDKFF